MIQVRHIKVYNIYDAIRGLRNPLSSWDKSDTLLDEAIGPKDFALAQRMVAAGTDEGKFMRQIFVSMDIEAPLYFWKQLDQYKVGTTTNSCSTMHTLSKTPITAKLFSFNGLESIPEGSDYISNIVDTCESLRFKFVETEDPRYWNALIELLPESFNQLRTWTGDYQVLRNIYFARRNHKLEEWHDFCNIIEELPYGKELICYEKEDK